MEICTLNHLVTFVEIITITYQVYARKCRIYIYHKHRVVVSSEL